jgi:serine/threonine protein kinase/Tfp pilus assembly protein PilF
MKSRLSSLRTASLDESQPADPELERLIEQVTARLQAGESINSQQLAEEYPQYAEQLRELLPAMEMLAKLGEAPVQRTATNGQAPPPPQQQLGDFRLIRELGRGGMGVVYEAEELSLGRRVALKVLLFAGMLDQQQLARFKNEARAAATLKHPHIVSVYSVSCERSVNYCAMELVEGQSLAQVIGERRKAEGGKGKEENTHDFAIGRPTSAPHLSPSTLDNAHVLTFPTPHSPLHTFTSSLPDFSSRDYYRTVARLGIEAAGALDHAHQNGVLHRDIKPANLLVDNGGKLWITDFGLARMEADAGMTMTGDLVGTLRYMSPEQALAKRVVVDHRSDIYSLGATLYELLTLQPAFGETDRAELLKRIAFDEPRSPRQINRYVPVELETIVLKAMRKSPEQRYATANELADDLRRFLENRPIKAKPPTLRELTVKWSRRHKLLLASVAVFVLLAAIGSSVSAVLLAEERDKTAAALEASEAQKRQLEIKSQQLERERRRAETNLQKARDAIDQMFTRVATDLADQPHMEQIRRQLLEDALQFYQGFLSQKPDDLAIQYETALAHSRVGSIYSLLGKYTDALKPLEQSCAMLEELVRQNPADPQYRLELARAHRSLSYPMIWLHRPDDYLANKRKELTVVEELQRQFPANAGYARAVAGGHIGVALALLEAGQVTKSIDEFNQSRALYEKLRRDFPDQPEEKSWLVEHHHWLGKALQAAGRMAEAEQSYRASLDLQAQILAEQPQDVNRRLKLAHIKSYLAVLLQATGRAEQALELFEQAIALDEECLDDFPDRADYIRGAAGRYGHMSTTLMYLGRMDAAEDALQRSEKLYERLLKVDAKSGYARNGLAWASYNLGVRFEATGKHDNSAELFRKAIGVFEQLTVDHPNTAKYHNNLAWMLAHCPAVQFRDPSRAVKLANVTLKLAPSSAEHWELLGMAQYRAGDFAAAIETLDKAQKLKDEAVDSWLFLAMANWQRGDTAKAREWYDKLRVWLDKNRSTDESGFRAEAEKLMNIETKANNPPRP